MKRNNNKGFTLAELLIVVAVIAVLVAVAIPTFGSQLEKSRQATDQANLRSAYAAAKLLELNQEDSNNTLHSTSMTQSDVVAFWVDVNDGTFTKVTTVGTTVPTDVAVTMGKAQTANLIQSKSELPSLATYVSKSGDDGTLATFDKGILASFTYDDNGKMWALADVTFSKTGKANVPKIQANPSEVALSVKVGKKESFDLSQYISGGLAPTYALSGTPTGFSIPANSSILMYDGSASPATSLTVTATNATGTAANFRYIDPATGLADTSTTNATLTITIDAT